MMRLGVRMLVVVCLVLCELAAVVHSQCTVTPEDWTIMYTALQNHNFFDTLTAQNQCNATIPDTLRFKYGACNQPLENVIASFEPNCRTFLASKIFPGSLTSAQLIQRAVEICTTTPPFPKTNFMGWMCRPSNTLGCPSEFAALKFVIFDTCHKTATQNLTREQQAEYFEQRQDKACMIRNNQCVTVKEFATCPLKVGTIFDYVDESNTFTCATEFPTVEDRCDLSYKTNWEIYCPPPTVLEANFYTIVVTCTVGPIALALLFLCYRKMYRAYHISHDDIILEAQKVDASPTGSMKMYHPELAAVVASKYKGVSFNPSTQQWVVAGKNQAFTSEQEAARYAYINLAGLPSEVSSNSSYSTSRPIASSEFPVAAYNASEPEEYVVTAVPPTAEQIKARRLQQLIAFYEFWEPTKPDIPAHADNLLNRHDFEHVARAIKTKYGVLPPGWAEEMEV